MKELAAEVIQARVRGMLTRTSTRVHYTLTKAAQIAIARYHRGNVGRQKARNARYPNDAFVPINVNNFQNEEWEEQLKNLRKQKTATSPTSTQQGTQKGAQKGVEGVQGVSGVQEEEGKRNGGGGVGRYNGEELKQLYHFTSPDLTKNLFQKQEGASGGGSSKINTASNILLPQEVNDVLNMEHGVDTLAHAFVYDSDTASWISKDATSVVRDLNIQKEKEEAKKATKKLKKINKRASM